MTNPETVAYWKEKLDRERNFATGSDNRLLLNEQSACMVEIIRCIKKYNDNAYQIARTNHHWWWLYNCAKRIMKKHNIKTDIYSNKKATKVWRKLFLNERFKGKVDIAFPPKIPEIINLLETLMYKDLANRDHYLYVIEALNYKE